MDIFSEGFDCPHVEFVQLARPTLSLAKYLQMVGRGLRVAEGKKGCVIIDNVGLYRVFRLPSQVWDWKATFEGRLKYGRKKVTTKGCGFFLTKGEQKADSHDSEMMMVMSLEELMQSLQYREIVDSNDDFAIVKLNDGKMTVVNRQGEQVIEPGNYHEMRLKEGNILFYRPKRKSVCYVDLLSGAVIDEGSNVPEAPKVVTLSGWEFIQCGELYMTRTYERFSQPFCFNSLANRGYYLIYWLTQYAMSGCQEWYYREGCGGQMFKNTKESHALCLLRGDYTHLYWLCANLLGGSIVVMDRKEDYYLMDERLEKTYIGCNHPRSKDEDMAYVMPRLGKKLYDEVKRQEKEKEASDMQLLHEKSEAGGVEPYQAGKKWGLRVDGKVVVPPLYHHIEQPVGAYCAFEQVPRHWGVMTLRRKVVVEAKYEKVKVLRNGSAEVTSITGRTETIKLKG